MSDWADKRERRLIVMMIATLAVLLAGELYTGVKPVTPPMLLLVLFKVILLVGGSIACASLVR